MGPALDKQKGNDVDMNACGNSATKANGLELPDMARLAFLKTGYYTSWEEFLIRVDIPDGSSTDQSKMALETRRWLSSDYTVCIFADLVRELFRERDVSLRGWQTFMTFINSKCVPGFKIQILDDFTKEGKGVGQRARWKEKMYFHGKLQVLALAMQRSLKMLGRWIWELMSMKQMYCCLRN